MADKSAKDKESSKDADAGAEKKPTVHKQTAKTMQDGVELTWDMHREGELKPEEAADFYVQSVEALTKFRNRDPRIAPELRAADKQKKDGRKALQNQLWGVLIGLLLALVLFGSRDCSVSSYDSPRRSYRR